MREDTDKEKETDRFKQLVLEIKKKNNSHTHARARPNKHTHTHDLDGGKKKNFSGLHAASPLQVPTTGGSHAVGPKHVTLTDRHTYLLSEEGWGRRGMWEGNWLQNLKVRVKKQINETNESTL